MSLLCCCIAETGDPLVVLWKECGLQRCLEGPDPGAELASFLVRFVYTRRQEGLTSSLRNLVPLSGSDQRSNSEAERDHAFVVASNVEDVVVLVSHPIV